MKKLILASVSGIALLGLAACSDTDGTTTQAVPDETQPMEPATPNTVPPAPTEPTTPPAE
ncbi:MAG: hypothetical protein IH590_06715 [Aquamicrobium sp.]|nr:hypothetical protein [Aquamicrobium sp.]